MCSRLHNEAGKLKKFASNVESVRKLRQERLAADARALLAETRAENLRLEGEGLNSKLQRALRRFALHDFFRIRVYTHVRAHTHSCIHAETRARTHAY